MTDRANNGKGLYLVLISVHGLIRGKDLELGRDSDTGGQILYVIELARALAELPQVERVDLLTRRVVDSQVSVDYARERESLSEGANIIRIEAGPDGYLRKEELWDHLDTFADNALEYLKEEDRLPDLIHSHYADGGFVGGRIAALLGVPLVHTGHSLGRVKRRRLLAAGLKPAQIEQLYNMSRRIDAEENVLGAADLVIASTHNEIEEQYGLYDYYQPEQMRVIPPGTNLERFHPPDGDEAEQPIAREIGRFLRNPKKPIILALSRPDERKNIATLIKAYGESPELQGAANLVIIAGNREDIREMESGSKGVLTDILLLIDQYDLYGKVAYPKKHRAAEVPVIYRIAAASRGVFVNPALTEPFGLTLLEAAASGLPVVATEDGGPQDIIGTCHNGLLVDPLDKNALAKALLKLVSNASLWQRSVTQGLKGVAEHYSWHAHARHYLETVQPLVRGVEPLPRAPLVRRPMLYHDRALFTDLDQNLLGDPDSLAEFIGVVRQNRQCVSFGIATGRCLESALSIMKRFGIPMPDVLITSVGTEIFYAPQLTADKAWSRHIDHGWTPDVVQRTLAEIPGLSLQPKTEQSRFKISYYIDPRKAPPLDEINSLLHQAELSTNTFLSFGQFLDIVPGRASKGLALRYFASLWGIPLEHILAAGGSGTDEDMMRGNTLAVVVSNRHEEELHQLPEAGHIYFAKRPFAAGIMEAIAHYDFLRQCRVPTSDKAAADA
ncbi:MAG: HAD family hydrolase [Gammaproteobacteria bacterium]|jgi:sucrose-phosphate synthase